MAKLTHYGMQIVHNKRIITRDIDQLLAVCEFALQDGIVDQEEAESILDWLNNHTTCLDTWPASVFYDRLRECLQDGRLDSDEQKELLDLVMSISRPPTDSGIKPTSLPVDRPAPTIYFQDKLFCFTGVFDFGSRDECIAATKERGGLPANGITKKLDYLVIGNVGSEFWKHTSFGTKIIKAMDYKENGSNIWIISEQHWSESIK
ncbi:BRCT domain-containing protein [Flavobacterium sp.]|jgi:NAD-dependent DNA ligase|uniref:BRCT domain-containing protein n=1 Tax=Flavobacterium sp. TaxID=239 RepID=UPI0037C05507